MFKTKNLSVYCGPGQNERLPSGDAFRASGKEHEAQAVRGPKDVPSRPMIFAYFSSQEKYEPSGLSVKREEFSLPYAGGTFANNSDYPQADEFLFVQLYGGGAVKINKYEHSQGYDIEGTTLRLDNGNCIEDCR